MKLSSRSFTRFSVQSNRSNSRIRRFSTADAGSKMEPEVLIDSVGNNAMRVILNRPKALNALNLSMIRTLTPRYKEWENKGNVIVIMKGAGDKAFCAGGDIRAIYEEGKAKKFGRGTLTSDFFYEEYNLNYIISKKTVTQVALLNGITMGGGVGLSVPGEFRVATENTLFAMPETGIGFFCDVGGSYFLSRLPNHLGMYLGLTGARLKGQDVLTAGIATHFVKAEKLNELESQLSSTQASNVGNILSAFNSPDKDAPSEITPFIPAIKECFSKSSVEAILEALQALSKEASDEKTKEWASKTVATLNKMSPTSLKVVHRQLTNGRTKNYYQCFQMEYRISQRFMRTTDFFEGVRATLIDKDKNPKWNPPTLAEVTGKEVDEYFKPAAEEWKPF